MNLVKRFSTLLRGSLRGRSIKQVQLHHPLMLCSCVEKSSSAFKGSQVAAGVCAGRAGCFKPVLRRLHAFQLQPVCVGEPLKCDHDVPLHFGLLMHDQKECTHQLALLWGTRHLLSPEAGKDVMILLLPLLPLSNRCQAVQSAKKQILRAARFNHCGFGEACEVEPRHSICAVAL